MKKIFIQILSFLFLAVLIFQSCEIKEKEPGKKSVEIIQKESMKENDTLNIIYFENKEIKEVDLKEYEGEKNVRLYFSKEGYLKQKTVNFDSYPQTNYEFNKNKIITHKWFEADIGGCVAISGKELFMDEKGSVLKEIVHTNYGNSCSEKVLVNEIIEYFANSKTIKTIYYTRESYEGGEESPCGNRKEFDLDGKLINQQELKDCQE